MSEPVRSAVAAEREYSDRKIVFDYCSGPAWPPVCRTVSGLAAVSESGRRVSGAGFFLPRFFGCGHFGCSRSDHRSIGVVADGGDDDYRDSGDGQDQSDDSFSHGRFGF